MSNLRIKRIYEPALPSDGFRVLVDRIWPRGVSKTAAALDLWLKEIAPSGELREWFGHDPARFDEFATRYRSELRCRGEAVDQLRGIAKARDTTLLYGAHDRHANQAIVLAEFLAEQGLHFERDG
ncbi:hypothetical protein NT2_12_01180 [Caenibius tardaugens NBRC 16725]|uniref:DUF488 domain-containing protein n=1 Tax=Caenibius tardaugens NBRC 16725 TaxID=1219035 RepID=U2ZZR2_9SPHN|nr:DUF488 domain-containing protein [Caenibius tardaugens]AZI36343.1 DUF488 domain-containing protein [Caenibius tardaugens NBRC 16725]GAD50859.1 hypothetical protein NT2_12_01180 [Caenibius tardaugens NBRC 16725]